MSRIRVLDVVKELGIETKVAISKLNEMGIPVKNHFNALSEIDAQKLRIAIRSGKTVDKDAAGKQSNKLIIRRKTETSKENDAEGGKETPDDLAAASLVFSKETEPQESANYEASVSHHSESTDSHGDSNDVSQEISAKKKTAGASSDKEKSASKSQQKTKQPKSTALEEAAIEYVQQDPKSQVASDVVTNAVLEKEFKPIQDFSEGIDTSRKNIQTKLDEHIKSEDKLEVAASSPTHSDSPMKAISKEAPKKVATTLPPAGSTGSAVIVRKAEPPKPTATSFSGNNNHYYQRNSQPQQQFTGGRQGFDQRYSQGNQGSQQQQHGNTQRPPMGSRSGTGYNNNQGGQGNGYNNNQGGQGNSYNNNQGGQGNGYNNNQGGQGNGYNNNQGRSSGSGQPYGNRPQGQQGAPRGDGRPQAPYSPRGNYTSQAGGNENYSMRSGGFPQAQTSSGRPFVMPETTTTSKEVPSRFKDREKEKERERRRSEEEEFKSKAAARFKGRDFESEETIDGVLVEDLIIDEGENLGVRTLVPNRKKAGTSKHQKRYKKQEISAQANPTRASKMVIRIDESITVADLAAEMSQKGSAVIMSLMKLGVMATINQVLDFDTAVLVAQEFGFEVQNTAVTIEEILAQENTFNKADVSNEEKLPRPPVVTIMGHVDHGKTSLLDAIRSANVASKEAGGITQHIGAYKIKYKDRELAFLDTPGHEAFTAMRARGAQVTDIVVLVVAADDGVMPQTIEAIAHSKAAKVPIIVAINKIDKPNPNFDRIQSELAEHGVLSEEWGGDAMFVRVSAKTHQGLNDLIETILLQSDVLELKAPITSRASGVVLEAKLDKSRGPVVSVLVTEGTLRQQDTIVAGTAFGRVRAMFDDKGNKISEASPSTPVEILGLNEVPASGDQFNCVSDETTAKEAVSFRQEKLRLKNLAGQKGTSMQDLLSKIGELDSKAKELSIIVKADTHGSVEAIKASLAKMSSEKVRIKVLHAAVGAITETDVSLAKASSARIFGFNVRPERNASQSAESAGIKISCVNIIYELIDQVQSAMLGTLSPVKSEKIIGHAEVRNTFVVPKIGTIAGVIVSDGKIQRNAMGRVLRDGIVIYTGKIGSLRRFKDDVKEVAHGFECGVGFESFNDIKVSDQFEFFIIEETAATLN